MPVQDVASVADLDAALAKAPVVSSDGERRARGSSAAAANAFPFSLTISPLPLQTAINFWAAWSEPGKAMDAVFEALAGDYPGAAFLRVREEKRKAGARARACAMRRRSLNPLSLIILSPVSQVEAEADALAAATERYGITVVPTFIFVKGGAVAVRVEGADAPALADAAAAHLKAAAAAAAAGAPAAASVPAAAPAALGEDGTARLQALVKAAPVMLFMKVRRLKN